MVSRKLVETSGAWRPTEEQSLVADLLARGYSQQAAARLSGVSQPQISQWINRDVTAAPVVTRSWMTPRRLDVERMAFRRMKPQHGGWNQALWLVVQGAWWRGMRGL